MRVLLFSLVTVLMWIQVSVLWAAPQELVLWHSYRAREKRALQQVVKAYNASQNKVRIKALKIPYDAYADKITAAIPRGHGPDLFIFAHDRIGDWADNKIIEPISFWVNPKLLGRFFPKTLKVLVYKNALYGLPLAFKSLALFYNKALVKTPPKTTRDLLATAKKLTNRSSKQYGLVYQAGDFYYHAPWLHGFGGRVFTKGKPSLNSKAAIQSFQFAQSLALKHKLLPKEPNSHLVSSLFNRGKAAMVINGPWFRGEIKAGLKYGVVPLPTVSSTGKAAAPFLTSEAVFLSKKSKHKKLAFGFVKYLTAFKSAMTRLTIGKQPVANRKAHATAAAKKDAIVRAFRAQLKTAIPMSNSPEMRMVWDPALNALGAILRNQATASKALEEAQKKVVSYIKDKKSKSASR